MAQRNIDIPDIGLVTFAKRKGSKSIRLRIAPHGALVVSMPYFVPYATAVGFVKRQKPWIQNELEKRGKYLYDGMSVGKTHVLRIMYDESVTTPKTRIRGNDIIVRHNSDEENDAIQTIARKACIRALKLQAAQYLPKRIQDVAVREGYTIKSITIKQLTGKWGSCNQDGDIILNIFLMELPHELIDYVIMHELAHTRQLNHSNAFWNEFEAHLPNAKQLRKQMRQFQPTIPSRLVT